MLIITVNIRTVDSVQYQNCMRSFDFDITTAVWDKSLSPGNEQRDWFGAPAADRPGSRNVGGIKNPAVDALIERIIFARIAPSWWRHARRSTAFCSGISIASRNSPSAISAMAAGSLQPSQPPAKYGVSGFPDRVVVGRRKGSQDRKAQLKEADCCTSIAGTCSASAR